LALGGGDVVVAKFHARLEIVFVELGKVLRMSSKVSEALQSFVGAGQSPMSGSKLLVNLDCMRNSRDASETFVFQ